ncbi:MAG: PIN domain-containing protein [Candidatus Omnitrophica bacterium]|nr:PIN domain-containing protein [Candidatus Omnitrophota bacterium]
MGDKQIFVDTNILVYAHDLDAQEKHQIAKTKIQSLWDQSFHPSTSIQVLQEFYVNLIRKNVPLKTARETIMDYLAWDITRNDEILLVEGMRLKERWDISFWDALILAAAKSAKARILWSEDFATDQEYEGILVVNPLK